MLEYVKVGVAHQMHSLKAFHYAKAISEVLPDAIQVADRFHLHQNLLQAVKDAIKRVLLEKIEVTDYAETTINVCSEQEMSKKNILCRKETSKRMKNVEKKK